MGLKFRDRAPHKTDRETEAQRGQGTSPSSRSHSRTKLGPEVTLTPFLHNLYVV